MTSQPGYMLHFNHALTELTLNINCMLKLFFAILSCQVVICDCFILSLCFSSQKNGWKG